VLPLKTAFIAHLKRELGVFSKFLAILPKVVPFILEFFSYETSDFYRLGSRSDVCELSAHHVKC